MKIFTSFDTMPHLEKLRYKAEVFSNKQTKKSMVSNYSKFDSLLYSLEELVNKNRLIVWKHLIIGRVVRRKVFFAQILTQKALRMTGKRLRF